MRRAVKLTFAIAAFLVLLPGAAFAQDGQIAGVVRDPAGLVMPGVLVEVTSPALIEKVRSATTDDSGQYRITSLPVGTYTVTFTLEGFSRQQRDNVALTTGFTAPVNATMAVGQRSETVTVVGESPIVDVQNARQVATFAAAEIRDLPTGRNLRSLLTLTPGLTAHRPRCGLRGRRRRLVQQQHLQPQLAHGSERHRGRHTQGRVMVDGTIINTGGGAGIMGMTGGYVADIANAQEVNVQISGALGESETGGASINIIPRTGGNKFSGNYFTQLHAAGVVRHEQRGVSLDQFELPAHQRPRHVGGVWRSNQARPPVVLFGRAESGRRTAFNSQNENIWDNKNAGIWGMNYQPDRSQAAAQSHQLDAQRQRAHHVSSLAEEQVQLLLGRGADLSGSV